MRRDIRFFAAIAAFIFAMMTWEFTVLASGKGPNTNRYVDTEDSSKYQEAYISIGGKDVYNSDGSTGAVSGAVYDASSNTLTLTGLVLPGGVLETSMMGDDFKICLKKKNTLGQVRILSEHNYGGSVTFTGSGKLTVNKKNTASGTGANGAAILVMSLDGQKATANKLAIKNKAQLLLYSKEGSAVYFYRTTVKSYKKVISCSKCDIVKEKNSDGSYDYSVDVPAGSKKLTLKKVE